MREVSRADLHVRRARVFRVKLKLLRDFRLFQVSNGFQVSYYLSYLNSVSLTTAGRSVKHDFWVGAMGAGGGFVRDGVNATSFLWRLRWLR